jgi:hypothetical protein
MKNKELNRLSIISFMLISLFACKKDEPVDYRDIMIGNYNFTIKYSSFPPSSLYKDTSLNFNGLIYKSNEFDNKIIVDWRPDSISFDGDNYYTQRKLELTVDKEGNLSFPEYHSIDNTRFSPDSYIRNDSINYWISSGGMGRAFIWDVLGTKTSN